MTPADLQNERAMVGAVLGDPRRLAEVAGLVRPGDLENRALSLIYAAACELDVSGRKIDSLTLASHLQTRGELEAVGGLAGLTSLDVAAPTSANAVEYARHVADRAQRRRLVQSLEALLAQARGPEGATADLVASAHQTLDGLGDAPGLRHPRPAAEAIDRSLEMLDRSRDNKGGITGLATGLGDLDQLLTGFHPGELIILAARPGVGKTACAMQWALHVAQALQRTAVVFSLEMPSDQLALRMLASEAKVSLKRLRHGGLSDYDMGKINTAAADIYSAPLHIDESSSLTLSELRAKVRRLKQQRPDLGLVVIDYLQLMSGDRSGGREQEVGEISRGLKRLAKELSVPVLALSQLNRKVEERKGGRPMLSDLRESGSLEQDADVVMFLHPEEQEVEDASNHRSVELIVAKQRNGPAESVRLLMLQECTRFEQRAPDLRLCS